MNRSAWKVVGCFLLASIALGITCSPALSTVIHVKTDGDDGNDGLTWETAKQTVQAGLDASGEEDEVWVAAGLYLQRPIEMPSGRALYGGLVGTETERDQRDWIANETILDANHTGSVLSLASGAAAATRIDGFTIGGGDTHGEHGGGIYCYGASPTIANNVIAGNTSWPGAGGDLLRPCVARHRRQHHHR